MSAYPLRLLCCADRRELLKPIVPGFMPVTAKRQLSDLYRLRKSNC